MADIKPTDKWFENVHHFGLIVRDAEKAARFYESLGLGPFKPLSIEFEERKLRGKSVDDLKLKGMIGDVGATRIELIQPVAGNNSLWQEYLESHGEGLHHIAFVVDDIEQAKADMVKKGIGIVYASKFKRGGGAAYLEVDKIGGTMFELFQRPGEADKS